MNLQENIFRIKQMMGLLNEQEDTSSLTVQEKLKNGQKLTPEELNVKGDLALGFSKVKSLPEGLKVGGDLSLHYCENLTSLPNGLKVGGDLFLNDCDSLTSLPNGLEVGGHLFLIDAKINSLPKRLVVGGSLDLTGSAITSLPRGLKVGGVLKVDNTELIKYPDEKLLKMIGSNGYIKLGIFRNYFNSTTDLEDLPWERQASSDTTGVQAPTPGVSTPPTPGGSTPKPHPNMENPFTPTNGDPWKYAYDGTKLIVKSPTGNEYNLNDPNYFTTYPSSKIKNEEERNKAIESIKTAYGDKLGMR